ncbi:hypothetical protein WN943_006891 [Citrus x changshan-huyou]
MSRASCPGLESRSPVLTPKSHEDQNQICHCICLKNDFTNNRISCFDSFLSGLFIGIQNINYCYDYRKYCLFFVIFIKILRQLFGWNFFLIRKIVISH